MHSLKVWCICLQIKFLWKFCSAAEHLEFVIFIYCFLMWPLPSCLISLLWWITLQIKFDTRKCNGEKKKNNNHKDGTETLSSNVLFFFFPHKQTVACSNCWVISTLLQSGQICEFSLTVLEVCIWSTKYYDAKWLQIVGLLILFDVYSRSPRKGSNTFLLLFLLRAFLEAAERTFIKELREILKKYFVSVLLSAVCASFEMFSCFWWQLISITPG